MTKIHLAEVYRIGGASKHHPRSAATSLAVGSDTLSGLEGRTRSEVTPWVDKIGDVNPDYNGSFRLNAIIGNAHRVFEELVRNGRPDLIPSVSYEAQQRYSRVANEIGRDAIDRYQQARR